MKDLQPNETSQGIVFSIQKVKNQKKWTKEEDEQLIQLAGKYSEKHWKEISKEFVKKNSLQCFSRYKRIRPGIIKGSWKKEEDIRILDLVSRYGKAWAKISKILGTRNGKQIRDRYINMLDPEIRKGKFTEEEDNSLILLFHSHGPKWAAIAKYYPNRTADMIKNRFHSSIKKKLGLSLSYRSNPSRYINNSDNGLLQIQSNPNSNCFGSPFSLDKAITSATGITVHKPESNAEVYSEFLSQDLNEEANVTNFFFSSDNNPFNMLQMEEPIQLNKEDETEWNYAYFLTN